MAGGARGRTEDPGPVAHAADPSAAAAAPGDGATGRPDPSLDPAYHAAVRQLFSREGQTAAVRARLRGLLDAVVGVTQELSLPVTLQKIIESACAMVDAEYGALGVIGTDQTIADLVYTGVGAETAGAIGHLPVGHGLIGTTLRDPRPLRLTDVRVHPDAYGFPLGHPSMRTFMGVPINVRGRGFGYLYLGGKRGGATFSQDDEDLVCALAASVGFAIENARLYEETRRRQAWLAASAEITAALLSVAEPGTALGMIARRARQVTAAQLAAIVLPLEPDRLTIAAAEAADGLDAGALRDRELSPGSSRYAEALSTGRALFVPDAATCDGLFGAADPALPLGAAMIVPLIAAGAATGVLVICAGPIAAPFTQLDLEMAAAFAGHAALALELSRVQRDRERLAVFEERDRIARDLHDIVIQRLFGTGLRLTRIARDTGEAHGAPIEAAVAALDQTIDDVRRTIFSLGSPSGSGGDLRDEIDEIVRQAESSLGLRPSLSMEGPIDRGVPEEVHPHLLAALREALANIARHARATLIEVLVRVSVTDVLVEVRDDGCGPTGASRTSGLANLRKRAQELGGQMEFGPGENGAGTTVSWHVPLGSAYRSKDLSMPRPPRVPRP